MKIQAQTKAKPAVPASADGKTPAVPAKAAKGPVEIEYNIPDSVADLCKAFGDEVVASSAKGAIIISAQAFMRRLMETGKKQDEIQKELSAWKPDARTIVKQTAFERASGAVEKLSPEERKALIAKLQAAK